MIKPKVTRVTRRKQETDTQINKSINTHVDPYSRCQNKATV